MNVNPEKKTIKSSVLDHFEIHVDENTKMAERVPIHRIRDVDVIVKDKR